MNSTRARRANEEFDHFQVLEQGREGGGWESTKKWAFRILRTSYLIANREG